MTIDFNRKIIQLIIENKQSINQYWISASKLYNYINDDPLLDWLNLYGKKKGYKTDEEIDYQEYCESNIDQDKVNFDIFKKNNNKFNFMNFILEQGTKYEEYVFNTLKEEFAEKIVNVANDFNFNKFEYNKKLEKTKQLILEKTPVIYQGLVCDPDTKTFGIPDFIIREDYFKHFILNDKQTTIDDNKDYYNYYIIDVKYHTLEYKSNSNDLISNKSQKQYISQLYLYTKGLRHLIHPSVLNCGVLDHKAFVIGRSWVLQSNNSVGCIHFQNYEKVLEKVKNGLLWYKEVKTKGTNWDPLNPTMYEMYPNMKNDKDNNWRKTKLMISEQIGEITMIWYCSNSIKTKAHSKGVFSWKSPNFNILKYTSDTETSKLINNIININNQSVRLYDYDKDANVDIKWKPNDVLSMVNKNTIIMDGFVDIENLIDVRSIDIPKQDSIVYMLGLYYNNQGFTTRTKNYKDDMSHKTFCVNYLDKKDEKKLIEDFLLFLKSFNCEKHITWRLYHYSGVEKYTLNKLLEDYNIKPETFGLSIQFIDLYDLLIKYKFVFKNCFEFSLKSINKILYQLEYIPENFIYKNSIIKNGLDSIIAIYKCDEECKMNNVHLNKLNITDDINYYNMIDCISLYHLRVFLNDVIEI
jgi:hypothetical protein